MQARYGHAANAAKCVWCVCKTGQAGYACMAQMARQVHARQDSRAVVAGKCKRGACGAARCMCGTRGRQSVVTVHSWCGSRQGGRIVWLQDIVTAARCLLSGAARCRQRTAGAAPAAAGRCQKVEACGAPGSCGNGEQAPAACTTLYNMPQPLQIRQMLPRRQCVCRGGKEGLAGGSVLCRRCRLPSQRAAGRRRRMQIRQ